MAQPRLVERAKLFFFRNFERIFVLLLVFAIVGIHALVEQKFAFLSFYYLPMILAGFYGGRRFAVLAGLFVVVLVLFYQYVQGLDMLPGFYGDALLALVPWAGFLILTGYVVGTLAEQREARLADVKNAYLATLELLTYHIESTERNQQGHSNRVADVAVGVRRELDPPQGGVGKLRGAGPPPEGGTRDPRLLPAPSPRGAGPAPRRGPARSDGRPAGAAGRLAAGGAVLAPGRESAGHAHPERHGCPDGHDRQQRDRQRDSGSCEADQEGCRRPLNGVDEPQPASHEVPRGHEAPAQRGGANQQSDHRHSLW